MKCSAYKQGKECNGTATHWLSTPSLKRNIEKHPLCTDCANERLEIKDYPWVIKLIK